MRRLLLLVTVLALFVPVPALAVYRCGAQTDDCQCAGYDPYPCCSNGGNCTWWAWEAACCNWGIALGSWGNANQWHGNAAASGYDIRDCNTPVTSAIANRTLGTYGHVAWSTGLNGGGGVHVQEQNCDYGAGSMDEANYRVCYFNGGFIAQGGQVQCNPGDGQSQGCGGCGSQSRGCGNDGRWGGWSGCGGGGSCTPGQTDTQGCGPCGFQTRTCGGDCQWGGWGTCGGAGECNAGQVDDQACCDCGHQQRTCSSTCHWDAWGSCAGADPAGAPTCPTGRLGVCAAGQQRCVSGCLACVPLTQPSHEVCDDLDNDCNGLTDDGAPQEFGNPRAAFAATVVDASFPRAMASDSTNEAWIVFQNVGTATWLAGQVSLRADAPAAGKPSRLAPALGWPAYDTAAVLDHDVAPGETAAMRFPLQTLAGGDIDETFTLRTPAGQAMVCPNPTVDLSIATVGPGTVPATASAAAPPPVVAKPKAAGCANVDAGAGALLLALLAAARRRQR